MSSAVFRKLHAQKRLLVDKRTSTCQEEEHMPGSTAPGSYSLSPQQQLVGKKGSYASAFPHADERMRLGNRIA